jgi:chemotaxis methyl-accepting protein methylase
MDQDKRSDEALLRRFSELTHLDLHYYKAQYLQRHIDSRMERCRIGCCADYITYLENNSDELKELIGSIGVNVTSFFRDPDVYRTLATDVVPKIIEAKDSRNERRIRIWSTSCATGEEPYSLAIILCEILGDRREEYGPSIFATDIDEAALERAQAGRYESDKLAPVSDRLRQNYFLPAGAGGGCQVQPVLQRLIRFKRHDLIGGAPISMLDLALCRNMLIYIKHDWQVTIFENLYRALRNGGYLVLGKTETLPRECMDRFRVVNQTERIYQKL